jgi:hypothetical protein
MAGATFGAQLVSAACRASLTGCEWWVWHTGVACARITGERGWREQHANSAFGRGMQRARVSVDEARARMERMSRWRCGEEDGSGRV